MARYGDILNMLERMGARMDHIEDGIKFESSKLVALVEYLGLRSHYQNIPPRHQSMHKFTFEKLAGKQRSMQGAQDKVRELIEENTKFTYEDAPMSLILTAERAITGSSADMKLFLTEARGGRKNN